MNARRPKAKTTTGTSKRGTTLFSPPTNTHHPLVSPRLRYECVVLAGAAIIITRMSAVKKLLHTRYRVNDLEKSIRFYVDVLGLQEVRRHKSPRGSELVFLRAPGGEE